ncbi:MAG: hypothetical protein JXX29_11445 [Deltaproteobacteria bacterium]|nr:hypothetical protein [Deltaproteobacteria bacterium]
MEQTEKPSVPQTQSKRQIRNFLIDKKFQLGWVFRVAGMVTLIVTVMGYFLYGTLVESIELINAQVLSTASMTEQAQQAIVEKGARDQLYTGLVLASSLAALVVVLSLSTIVVTHKVAGPAYKIKRLLSTVDGDHLQLFEKLRKGDELHEVFKEFSDMLRRLRESRHLDIEQLETVTSALKAEGRVSDSNIQALELMLERYRKSIAMDD